ncbi:SDR family NAD(P)-dependent oxidoreductase [Clostridium sp. JNZ X4-2]
MKTILITGASNGIGKYTAMKMAKQGYQLIIHGRNQERTKAVYDEIIKETGNQKITMLTADFSLMSEVKRFADNVKDCTDHIDILYNNAGGQFGNEREVTAEGHEKTFAINTLSPFLLASLLLPLLEKSESARIVAQSSESYQQGGDPILDDIELENHYSLYAAYGLSKLYVWWTMRQLNENIQKKGIKNVTVNCTEPGTALDTGLQRVSGEIPEMKALMEQYRDYSWPIAKAAECGIYMMTSPEVEGVTGKFYGDCKEKNIDPKWFSEEGQKVIWDYCSKACEQYLR